MPCYSRYCSAAAIPCCFENHARCTAHGLAGPASQSSAWPLPPSPLFALSAPASPNAPLSSLSTTRALVSSPSQRRHSFQAWTRRANFACRPAVFVCRPCGMPNTALLSFEPHGFIGDLRSSALGYDAIVSTVVPGAPTVLAAVRKWQTRQSGRPAALAYLAPPLPARARRDKDEASWIVCESVSRRLPPCPVSSSPFSWPRAALLSLL